MSRPGLSEACKIVLNPSRQTILLLSRMIEQGIENRAEEESDELLSFLPDESVAELKAMADDMLYKSGLVDFYGRLKMI